MIKALFFDVFGTVVDYRSSVTREMQKLSEAKGWNFSAEQFADDWRNLYNPSMEPVRSGERPYTRLDILHRENLDQLIDKYGIDNLSEEEKDHLNRIWHRLDPWPDSVPGLLRLKSKFVLATMSNGNVSLMVNMAKHAGLPWDMILGSEPAKSYKPVPKTYLTGADWLDLKPEQICMVAAHNGDLRAARELGFKTAFILRPTEKGPNQTIDVKAEEDWDYSVNSMEELADSLGC